MQATANGITIEYESYGSARAPAVLLIMGLGAQLTRWPRPMIDGLVERGWRAIIFDNRDVGLSDKIERGGLPDLMKIMAAPLTRGRSLAPYTLDDMAADAVGLLDALDIERAHLIGASMGGMIAQMVAALYPARALSLTSIMSSTGNPGLPRATAEASAMLMSRPQGTDLDALVEHSVKAQRVIGSPGYPADEKMLRERIRAEFERMHYPAGFARQLAAIYASGDRRDALARISVPTVVVHGADDPLVPVAAGRDTAAVISGARLMEIPGMGHDLPPALVGQVLDAFESVARPAAATA